METYENQGRLRLWIEGGAGELRSLARMAAPRPAVRFCIFAQGRTGSTLLTSSLDSHPEIRCADEILRRPRRFPAAFLDRMARGRGYRAFGFHVKLYQLTRFRHTADVGGFLRRLADDGWLLVHLTRRDVVAHVFSNRYARAARRFHFGAADRRAEDPRIRIEPQAFARKVAKRLRLAEDERAALAGLAAFPLVYEDDLLDPLRRAVRLGDLQAFLRVTPRPLTTSLAKSVRRSPWELMENPEEVRRALEDAGLGAWADGEPAAAPLGSRG